MYIHILLYIILYIAAKIAFLICLLKYMCQLHYYFVLFLLKYNILYVCLVFP